MWPDRVSNPGPLTYESGALPTALRGPTTQVEEITQALGISHGSVSTLLGGGRVMRWFQCRGVLLIWIRVGQGSTALAVGAGGGRLDIFSLIYHFSFPSPSLWETARYRLKYCLKGPLSPKQPTNQPFNTLT